MVLDKHLIVKTYPIANEGNIVIFKDYRITVLADRLFRVEKNKNKIFRDGATQSVWYRNMPKQTFSVKDSKDGIVITTTSVKLNVKENLKDMSVELNGKEVKVSNDGNLMGTYRTLDCCDGDKHYVKWEPDSKRKKITLEYGICSKTGVAYFDDAKSLTLGTDGEVKAEKGKGADYYVFAYGDDYRSAVNALYMITGKPPMLPRYALGNWWSRYYRYTDKEYLRLLNRFEEKEIPLTVATIDMDWHYSDFVDEEMGITKSGKNTPYYGGNNGWTGYTWNKNLFPDYKAFLKEIEKRNLKITLNLHPADGIRWWEDCYSDMATAMGLDASCQQQINFDIANPTYINNYFKILHKPFEEDGVSFWWIDWQQGVNSGIKGLDPLWALNHYHFLDNKINHDKSLILSRYSGIGSHRYPVGFSGDTYITWKTLRYLPYFTATASNVGYTWWSHDIGGHMGGAMNNELYLRHIQYGVFSPINRLHCSREVTITKEPWVYGNGAGRIAEDFLKLRHRMIPFIYSVNYATATYGKSLIEPLYYEWKDEKAYDYKNEYLFGDLLVAPVTEPLESDGFARVNVWLPKGRWTDIFTGDEYDIKTATEKTLLRRLESIPVLARAGAVIPLSLDKGNSVENPKELEILVFNGDGKFTLYEDDGDKKLFTEFVTTETKDGQILKINCNGDRAVIPADRSYKIKFKNIPEGNVIVLSGKDSVCIKEHLADCVTITLPFKNDDYTVTVTYKKPTALEKLKVRAQAVLSGAEGHTDNKFEYSWKYILQANNIEEYVDAVDRSIIRKEVKERLKETL